MNRIITSSPPANRTGTTDSSSAVATMDRLTTPDRQTNRIVIAQSLHAAETESAKLSAQESRQRDERRKQRRTRVSLSVRLSPADLKDGKFDEIQRTLNSCRNGLYFTAAFGHFYEQMRLRIVFPYTSDHDSVTTSPVYGQVLRVDRLPDGTLGVAVHLLGCDRAAAYLVPAKANRPAQKTAERRVTARYPFTATASVMEPGSGARLQARCSDLSLSGCYVDTINPFPQNARVEVRLSCGNQNFVTEARVSFSHMNLGMGLDFCALTPEQELMLVEWLSGGGAEPAEETHQPEIVEASSLPDKALTLRLIKLLRSKGSLKEADVSILLSKYMAKDEDLGSQTCPDLF